MAAKKAKRSSVKSRATAKRSPTKASHSAPAWDALGPAITARITRLRKTLGDPFREDRRLASYAAAIDDRERMESGRTRRAPKPDFLARVDAFLAAHEIARRVLAPHAKKDRWGDLTSRAAALFDVESIARGHVRTLSALKYLEEAFFTAWNEGPPVETAPFWREVKRAKLPFEHRDLLVEIFDRGRISSREHYEFAVDVLGVGEDDGLFDAKQAKQLSQMIGAYERKR